MSKTTRSTDELLHGELTGKVIGAFYAVYDALGYGFLETVYRNAMAFELRERGLSARVETRVNVWYKRRVMGFYRADLVVESKVIVEIKASRAVDESDRRQLDNLLTATDIEVGLLLHFGPKPAFSRLIHENRLKTALQASL